MLLTNRKHTSVTFYQPVWCGTGRLERDTACHNPAFYLLWDLWSTYFSSLEPVSSSLKNGIIIELWEYQSYTCKGL